MVSVAQKIFKILSPEEQRRALMLMAMIVCMGLVDMIGVVCIVPFMSVMAQPEIVESNPYLRELHSLSGINEPTKFLFFLGLLVLVIFISSVAFKAFTTYQIARFSSLQDYMLSSRLIASYLHQPYEWFLNRNSSELGKTVLTEVGQVVSQGIFQLANAFGGMASTFCLVVMLISADPALAATVFTVLLSAYTVIYLILRKMITTFGSRRWASNQKRFEVVAEAFGGIKEIKLDGLETVFCERFREPALINAKSSAVHILTSQLPKYAFEAISFGGMIALALYLMVAEGSLQASLPTLALYALAGYRMLPMMQQVYNALATLKYSQTTIDKVCREFLQLSQSFTKPSSDCDSMRVNQEIRFRGVSYRYPKSDHDVISELSFVIPAYTTVGLVGSTGSGKTTTSDLILGLLSPKSGQITVDGTPISLENVRTWQRSLGYVPQVIYLSDDTIASNIAFGVKPSNIDWDALEEAARIANLHDFVSRELKDGYQTLIGERGVRLSGGQRQRIGIARALYKSPKVLILDEATSALDNLTERAVMEAVNNLSSKVTIVLIAHRLTTVRNCDQIILLDRGKMLAVGTYDELMATNERFRDLTLANVDNL
jgi:ABC-type multidrug transport system fused ATPase/permease subunit